MFHPMTQAHHLTVINRWVSRQITSPFSSLKIFHLRFNCTHKSHHQFPPYSSILKSVKDHPTLLQVHAQIVASGFARNVSFSNNLMNSYASFCLTSDAQKNFYQIPDKNIFYWTILISGLTRNDLFVEAVDSFGEMVESGLLPNEVTISSILPAFANLGLKQIGKSVHCFWVRRGFGHNEVVETSLVDMYSHFGCMGIARYLFDKMHVRNLVTWNVIISGYANNGMGSDAVQIFNSMRRNGVFTDYFTIMSLILASSGVNWGRTSTAIHGLIMRTGYRNEQKIQTALINMYTSGNFISEAYGVFDEMCVKDVVAWTMMLESFLSGQYWSRAIEHFNQMMRVHYMTLDSTAIASILSVCSCSGALQQGEGVHALIKKQGFNNDVFVGCALIDMYSKSGDLDNARKYFCEMEEKDVTCWNAMIGAMGANGNGYGAIDLLFRMEFLGVNPNESTLVSVLSACSHSGKVDEGLQIFNYMVERWGIVPSLQHYACLVDLLSRSGRLDEANLVIAKMPLQPYSAVYGALLGACRVYGDTRRGSEIFQKLLKLDLVDLGHVCSMSNMYASLENWDGTTMSRTVLKTRG